MRADELPLLEQLRERLPAGIIHGDTGYGVRQCRFICRDPPRVQRISAAWPHCARLWSWREPIRARGNL